MLFQLPGIHLKVVGAFHENWFYCKLVVRYSFVASSERTRILGLKGTELTRS